MYIIFEIDKCFYLPNISDYWEEFNFSLKTFRVKWVLKTVNLKFQFLKKLYENYTRMLGVV